MNWRQFDAIRIFTQASSIQEDTMIYGAYQTENLSHHVCNLLDMRSYGHHHSHNDIDKVKNI